MHLSAFALDALALGTETAGAREHLAACSRCRAEYDAAAELRAHFVAHVLPRGAPVRRRRAWWPLLAIPALAAIALIAVRPKPAAPPAGDLAIKGDATWQVFANRDGQTFAVHDGTRLDAGDRIRFAVVPDGARYLLVASIDGAGAVSVYYPYGGTESAPLPPDARVELPGSIVLDAAPGPERLFAVFSDAPIASAGVAEQLRSIAAGGADAIRGMHTLDVPARTQASLVFEKESPP